MRTELKRLHQMLRTTVVYVTHDQIEAMTLATRIAVMRDGRIEQLAAPDEVYDRPATLYVAGFVGSPPMNILDAEMTANGLKIEGCERCFPCRQPSTSRLGGAAREGRHSAGGIAARSRVRGSTIDRECRGGGTHRAGTRDHGYGRQPAHHRLPAAAHGSWNGIGSCLHLRRDGPAPLRSGKRPLA